MEKDKFEELLNKANNGDVTSQNELGKILTEDESDKEKCIEGFKWFLKAAEAGYSNSQFNLAYCYHNGVGVDIDHKKSIYWYDLAAKQDDIDAIRYLALTYQDGEDCILPDEELFKKYCLQGIELNDPFCMVVYAKSLNDDFCIEKEKLLEKAFPLLDKNEDPILYSNAVHLLAVAKLQLEDEIGDRDSIKYFKLAADIGSTIAKRVLWTLNKRKELDIPIETLKTFLIEAAEDDDLQAICYAIVDNINGYCDSLSNQEIIEKLTQCAQNNIEEAYYPLSKYLIKENKINEAIEFLKMEVENDNSEACYDLAELYVKHYEFTKELLGEVVKLMVKADLLGNLEATSFLAKLYSTTFNDRNTAQKYYKKLLEHNHKAAFVLLYEEARNNNNIKDEIYYLEKLESKDLRILKEIMRLCRISKNYTKYLEITTEIANTGDEVGILEMAKIYFDGVGVNKNYELAYEWLQKIPNNPHALYMIGQIYEFGYLHKVDYEKAVQYYQKASELNHKEAKLDLNKFKKTMFGKWKKRY